MIRKTLLLTGVAGALLMAAPALAQDIPPPAPQPGDAQSEQPQSLTLQPGAVVRGSDGTELGRLEGVRANAAGEQELTVRGADGQVRGVPLSGLSQSGAEVSVAWTAAEFEAAPPLDAEAPETPPAAPPQPDPSMPVEPTPPTLPPEPDSTAASEPDDTMPPTDPGA